MSSWIATAAEIREIDRRAIEEFGIPPSALMEQAGFACFQAVQEYLSKAGRTVVVCGKGNNGGDGFVVARLLREHGRAVACFVAAKSDSQLSKDAAEQFSRAVSAGVQPAFAESESWIHELRKALQSSEASVDALLGTGASGDLEGLVKEAVEALNASGRPIVAVDIPTGIDCDTGQEKNVALHATRTVTFGLPKPFLFQGAGLENSGRWSVADIGYPESILGPTQALLLSQGLIRRALPQRGVASNKGENGHVLVVAGSRQMPGAASLVARAALRSGAGLVTVACVESVCEAVAAQCPEVLFLVLPDQNGLVASEAAQMILERQDKFDAAVFGPGLTHEEPVREFLRAVWKEWHRPAVVDADGLNAAAEGVEMPHRECALTPHPGELARLLGCSVAEIQADRFASARRACTELKHPVLLKGAYTLSSSIGQP
ncbi:MAG: ADP-dependent NAD(P)H-hydrate dehydratase / NAD(P)H-hydrate epimerase, partial [Fimbriimonadaceae bacterium]|nr:ADP-dependent NAD(P)H-hydrate dehydratase / NAD(P)H-hydrate epimerase [Fimbriimonadaceae bacterium]